MCDACCTRKNNKDKDHLIHSSQAVCLLGQISVFVYFCLFVLQVVSVCYGDVYDTYKGLVAVIVLGVWCL